jgi:glycosyltransferase involved in cell wall biosynthesis
VSELRVGLIAPPWVAVPPPIYGGTEAVVDLLARGLAEVGCRVKLFTTGDSTCPVERNWLYPEALGTMAAEESEQDHVERAYAELGGDVDVIHDHTLLGLLRTDLHPPGVPVVTTVHGPFTPEMSDLFRLAAAAGVGVVAVSHAQRDSAPDVPVIDVIHHGVDVSRFPYGRGDGGYVLFLGRMSSDKGAHRAIEVARAARRKILLAAKMWEPAEHRYFAERVAPLLGDDAVYIGEVGGERKMRLLAGAEALVNPIRWPEPFGLVMIEAMACGTPVLAFREGAAPEIVAHGTTGFLCRDEHDMANHLALVPTIDRRRCRDRVETQFSARRMVNDYLRLYRRAIIESADPREGPHDYTRWSVL